MAFIDSGSIEVFPSTGRGSNQYNARNLSEYNLSNLINQLTGKRSFVISRDYTPDGSLEFNLGGYYFKINALPNDVSNWNDIFVGLKIEEYEVATDPKTKFNEIAPLDLNGSIVSPSSTVAPLDTGGKFVGLMFSGDELLESNYAFVLHLLTYENNSWKIPEKSRIAFEAYQFDVTALEVDGGEI